jgi:hypothetical protein
VRHIPFRYRDFLFLKTKYWTYELWTSWANLVYWVLNLLNTDLYLGKWNRNPWLYPCVVNVNTDTECWDYYANSFNSVYLGFSITVRIPVLLFTIAPNKHRGLGRTVFILYYIIRIPDPSGILGYINHQETNAVNKTIPFRIHRQRNIRNRVSRYRKTLTKQVWGERQATLYGCRVL